MEHKTIRIIGFLTFIIVTILAILYNYFVLIEGPLHIRLMIKVSPVLCYMLFIIIYFFIYRVTFYSVFMLGFLFLCMMGDIFITLYDPVIENAVENGMLYFIVSGVLFFIARILLIFIFILKPYSKISIIRHQIRRSLVSHFLFTLPFLIFSILNLVFAFQNDFQKEKLFMYICISLYLFLGFGLPMSYSFLRINVLQDTVSVNYPESRSYVQSFEVSESFYSSSFAFIGITLFNISDILLLSSINGYLPAFCLLISINIYWIALFFLVISTIRSPYTLSEKGEFTVPILQDLA